MCWLVAHLLLFLLKFIIFASVGSEQCYKDVSFETVLQNTKILHCKVSELNQDCTVMSHLSQLAEKRNINMENMIRRTTVAVLISNKLTNEFKAAWNASLEAQVTKHLAFFGVMDCSKKGDAEMCKKLRSSCFESNSSRHHIVLLSGHCSETITCAQIETHVDMNGNSTMAPDVLSFVAFRLLERQLFIAKELDEVRLTMSEENEYLIQKEMQDAHGSQLISSEMPVAMFVTWPVKTAAYYHIFSMFLDAALTLKELFSFHVVTARLSRISKQSKRPIYRYELEDHQAYLALYTKEACYSKNDWPFSCKPKIATADSLLTVQQFSGFLLHQALKGLSLKSSEVSLSFPAFAKHNKFLEALVEHSDSFILAVTETEEALIDPVQDWEKLRDLQTYLGALLSLTFYPLVVTKPLAVKLLAKINSDIMLTDACDNMCFVIGMPGGGYELLNMYDPVMKLETAAQNAIRQSEWYHANARLSLDNIDKFGGIELPRRLTGCGHFVGGCHRDYSDEEDTVEPPSEESRIEDRTDAFVEQSKFSEVYNTTGVLVVETSQELLRDFLNRVGVDKPWLVLFTVSWSPSCKAARAIWSAVDQCVKSMGLHGVQLVKVDCFEANELCNNYLGIDTYPTVAMFKRGVKISTYFGPITHGRLCAYANLALSPNLLSSKSSQETSRLLDIFLPLMSRVFIFKGARIPDSMLALTTEMRFREAFIFEQLPKSETDNKVESFSASYLESYPATKQFEGDIHDKEALKKFVTNGHLDLIFPCNWIYLAHTLNGTQSVIMLFHTTSMAEHLTLLKQMRAQFSTKGASVCHVLLKRISHLDDLVQRIAGHNLPALVILTDDRKVIHRLPLGLISPDLLISETSNWVEQVLSGRLTDGHSVLSGLEQWEPSNRVYNFVNQVYLGKPKNYGAASKIHRVRVGGRPFAADDVDSHETRYGALFEVTSPTTSTEYASGDLTDSPSGSVDAPATEAAREEL